MVKESDISGAEGEVLLAEVADGDGEKSDGHLAGSRVPTKNIYTELEAKVIDGQINSNDENIARKLAPATQR